MPVLKNPRREIFAQEIAKGTFATKAHGIAGYKSNDGNASKLASSPEIVARVKEIMEKAATRAEISVSRVLNELAKLSFSNMDDYITVGSDGLPFVDFSRLDRDQKAAIQEVYVETTTTTEVNEAGEREAVPVRKVRFKLADKRMALVDIGKHLGMFKEQVVHSVDDHSDKSSEEMWSYLLNKMKELGVTPEMLALPVPNKMIDVSEGATVIEGVANKPTGKNGTKH